MGVCREALPPRAAPAGRPLARLFRLEFGGYGVRGDASGFWVQGRGCLSSNSTSRERARESVRESEREREREREGCRGCVRER